MRLLPAVAPVAAAAAACGVAAAADAPAPVGAGSVLQVVLGLAVVLGLVFAAAWAMRRFHPGGMQAGGALRVVAGSPVGARERVLLLEVGDTWLVVGVAPGRVTPLHSMPRPAQAGAEAASAPAPANFSAWLRQTLERRGGRGESGPHA